MGDPRRIRSAYHPPMKIWDADRIKTERKLINEYGLKNVREIWVTAETLKKKRRQARRLLAKTEEERKSGEQDLILSLTRRGVMKDGGKLDDVLTLNVRDFLGRRLQTIVFKRGLAMTPKQARQLIVHGFIAVNGRKIDVPSYLVAANEEDKISYYKAINISAGSGEENKPKPQRRTKKVVEEAPDANVLVTESELKEEEKLEGNAE